MCLNDHKQYFYLRFRGKRYRSVKNRVAKLSGFQGFKLIYPLSVLSVRTETDNLLPNKVNLAIFAFDTGAKLKSLGTTPAVCSIFLTL